MELPPTRCRQATFALRNECGPNLEIVAFGFGYLVQGIA
jgi:hypothetical protein